MATLAKKAFGAFAGAAMLATPLATATAEDAANNNAQVTQVAAVTPQVQFVNATDRTENDARFLAATASRDKVAIVVWGGNRALQQEAYNAARDLAGAGIPTAFVLAPDHNSLSDDAVMQVYAASTPRSDAAYGTNYAGEVRSNMRSAGLTAYREAFPTQVAQLSLN